MNAQQLIKLAIIQHAFTLYSSFLDDVKTALEDAQLEDFDDVQTQAQLEGLITADNIDEVYDALEETDAMYDAKNEVRGHSDSVETQLSPLTSSRHYEVDCMAMKIEGQWVGWDYLYGGGKHGEPEAVDWIATARLVSCNEEQVMVTKRTFEAIQEEAQA